MPISNPMGNMSRKTRFHIGYWVAAILGFLVLQYFYVSAQKIASIPYSQFEHGAPLALDGGSWNYRMLAARAFTIAGGTSEIQHNIIGERVLGLPKG